MCEPHAKRKALLVGISDDGSGQPLPAGPRNDVLQMRKLLINKYKFEKADIVDMYDKQKEKRPHLVPTRENILREIRNLVKDCQPGDRFLFHYSGHAGQQENLDGSELDGLDECLETKTGRILDDELKTELVDRLCPGSQLVAIFDACHSATLTDLPHVRCHGFNANETTEEDIDVALPTNVFGQRTNLPRARFASFSLKKPHLTLDTSFPRPIAVSSSLTSIPSDNTERFPPPIDMKYPASGRPSENSHRINIANVDHGITFYGRRCFACHDPQRNDVEPSGSDLPRVLVVSACRDSQVSYEDERGRGMTTALCDYLNDNPNPSLRRLFNGVSFKLFRPAFDRVRSPEWHEVGDNFPNAYQELSFSSLQRLNTDYKITF